MQIRGLASLTLAVRLLCRINGLFASTIRPHLTGPEAILYDALIVACTNFEATFPLGG